MRTASASSSQGIRADVFPAIVTIARPGSPSPASTLGPDADHPSITRLDRVRVIVTLDRVTVFRDSAQGPAVVLSERLDDYTPAPHPRTLRNRTAMRSAESTLTTASGHTLAFRRGSGCGCGSRLKTLNVFAAIPTAGSVQDT